MMKYKLSIQLYKAFNDANQKDTWTDLNFQQMFGQRMDSIQIFDNSTHKVGRNVLINRLNVLNGHIKFDWMNLSIKTFKLRVKNVFLKQ